MKKTNHFEKELQERVKELSCLYSIAKVSGCPTVSTKEVIQKITDTLPTALQNSQEASARITLDDNVFCSERPFSPGNEVTTPIVVRDQCRGTITIGYPPQKSPPILEEEKRLLDEVARQVGLIIDRRETAEEQERLHAKLQHADRLATIGQLAAGVAHELNEPLGSILGFAQLLKKTEDLPAQSQEDISKIEAATLHARNIIRQLMTFARQNPPSDVRVDLNQLIKASEAIWHPRCMAEGIRVEYALDENIPDIIADDMQLRQVVTNLAVNAIQAMQGGGTIRIETAYQDEWIQLRIKDDGCGISPEVLPRIFDPFFTTKDVDEGTGLGLSVVYGIISGHQGSVSIESTPGNGTLVSVNLPARRPAHTPQRGELHG